MDEDQLGEEEILGYAPSVGKGHRPPQSFGQFIASRGSDSLLEVQRVQMHLKLYVSSNVC